MFFGAFSLSTIKLVLGLPWDSEIHERMQCLKLGTKTMVACLCCINDSNYVFVSNLSIICCSYMLLIHIVQLVKV